jgi:hypothetical protein
VIVLVDATFSVATCRSSEVRSERKVQVTVDAAELGGGFDHAGDAPAQSHLSVSSAFDAAGMVPTDPDQALHAVGRSQGSGKGGRHTQVQHGQRLV